MAIDENYIELINADIDGELNDADKAELETYLAENAEARELHAELAALCDSLDGVEAETPPPHLRHVIMSSVKPKPAQEPSPGFFESLFATPALKYAATFAAGVIRRGQREEHAQRIDARPRGFCLGQSIERIH